MARRPVLDRRVHDRQRSGSILPLRYAVARRTPPVHEPARARRTTARTDAPCYDHETDAGRELLTRHSLLRRVDRIRKPLLIGQGANDPRVTQAESDQIVTSMQSKEIPVVYVLYPDEGPGFARPENRLSFYAIAEAFFAEYLGGRVEPIGTDLTNSSLQVPAGADQVPGLVAALAQAAR
ncbi:MAG: hypothetical protein EA382_13230 [Spirochaetaceae bacterium]|nr:MAG: hypothetical protein EA382_13230 [Spirochaetaceae bacterium]